MSNSTLKVALQQTQGDFEVATALETVGETPVACALTITDSTNPIDWIYSATAEDNLHQRSEADAVGAAYSLDGQPGLIYNGPAGITQSVMIEVTNLDVSEGTIAPEATDDVVAAVYVNSEPVLFAPEGYTAEIDTETAVEFNLEGIVRVRSGDVVRVGLQSRSEGTVDWNVAEGGEFGIR